LLSHWLGRLRATEIAVGVAVVVAAGLFVYGLIAGHLFLTLGAVFVFFAGQQELAAVRYREMTRDTEPLEVVRAGDVSWLDRAGPQRPDFTGFTWDNRAGAWIVWRNGQPIQAISTK
jgi:hypothetical protein